MEGDEGFACLVMGGYMLSFPTVEKCVMTQSSTVGTDNTHFGFVQGFPCPFLLILRLHFLVYCIL